MEQEPTTISLILSSLPAILAALGGVLIGYYNYSVRKREGDYKSISQLQEHVAALMERNEKQDKTIGELQLQNAQQTITVTNLVEKLQAMQEEIDSLEGDLAFERGEKLLYKQKYEKELSEKMFILNENQQMKKDIETLKSEISSLKAQLGITTR